MGAFAKFMASNQSGVKSEGQGGERIEGRIELGAGRETG
jgi:hypothetical protein